MVSLIVIEETSLAQICNDLQTLLDNDKVTVLQEILEVEGGGSKGKCNSYCRKASW